MVLSLLPDRGTEERKAGREGKRVTEGVLNKKEGCSTRKHKVFGAGRSECLGFKGGCASALQDSVCMFEPQQNTANMIHQTTQIQRFKDFQMKLK